MIKQPYIIIFLAMLASAMMVLVFKSPEKLTTHIDKVDLEIVIPKQFANWKIDETLLRIEPSPEVQDSLKKIYTQTLSRTYVDENGYRIILSIAYGSGFDNQLDVHRPEFCYQSQGFEVGEYNDQVVKTEFGQLPLRRMVAIKGNRIEPISYWITIGGETVSSSFQRKLLKIKRTLSGKQDSGMLVRISSIDADNHMAYKLQGDFINALLKNTDDKNRKLLLDLDEQN